MKSFRPTALAALFLGLVGLSAVQIVAGCGGDTATMQNSTQIQNSTAPDTRKTQAEVTVIWPDRASKSRLIPVAANSLKLTLTNIAANFTTTRVVVRPATGSSSTVNFSDLPPGDFTATATAHSDEAGNASPALAQGAQSFTGKPDETFAIALTMASTIDRLVLTPPTISVVEGNSFTTTVSARNVADEVVVTASTYNWDISDPTTASTAGAASTASVSGLKVGTTTLTVTESESRKTASATVTVMASPTPSPTPTPTPSPMPTPTPSPTPGTALTAQEINQRMGTGFNLGNTFDMAMNPTESAQVQAVIDLYFSAGMRHVRIPVTWMDGFSGDTLADNNGNLRTNHPRLLQLDAAIDYALSRGMVVMINTHHEHWLKSNYDGSEAFRTRFARLWTGIATRYSGRSANLIFEVLNEPEGAFGDWNGAVSPSNPTALARTREINLVGYQAIRATGGANVRRVIVVAPNGQGNQSMLDEVYPNPASLPGGGSDRHVMASVHTYDPWAFCGQDGTLSAQPTTEQIRAPILAVAAHARTLGIPVNYGEYGVGRNGRQEERNTSVVRDFYRTVRATARSQGMSDTPWDDQGWFGLITREEPKRFVYNIVPWMMQ